MNEKDTIPKEISPAYGKDYAWLREQGLHYIEQLSGRLWTDYNTHDPGITIMELLSWVITDLGYRMAMPIQDIVAHEKDNEAAMHRQFLSALRILPTAPVTATDYRKLFVRLDGVRNAWMQKASHSVIADYYHQPPRQRYAFDNERPLPGKELKYELNGLYNILLDVEESHKSRMKDIVEEVKSVFHHFRNLCEDVIDIKEVPTQEIVLCGEIELDARADPEAVWAKIIHAVQLYLSPEISFYTLEEMLEKNIPTHRVFEGPVFNFNKVPITGNPAIDAQIFTKKGFVDDIEVKQSGLREQVRLSDVISLIMKVEGVKLIKSIQFGFCGCDEKDIVNINKILDRNEWLLCVKEGFKPVLCLTNSVINFYKNVIPLELKDTEARMLLQKIKDDARRVNESKAVEDLPMPQGTYRDIKSYHSIQLHLPETYGIGTAGLPGSASTARKAQAKQLKAYLLFFDQVLAGYFSQLSHVTDLLGADPGAKKTYFTNAVKSVAGDDDLFAGITGSTSDRDKWENWESATYALMQAAGLDKYAERKNKLLDHLLGRFAEQFNEYVFLLHRIYGEDYDHAIIRNKKDFFADYNNMSAYRADALDYYNRKTPEELLVNVSGMEKRISRLLGFNHYRRQKLSQLPYDVFRITPEDPHSTYSWTIFQNGNPVLQGNNFYIKQVDAYENMGLASILGAEPENYRTVVDELGKVWFELLNSKKKMIARSSLSFDTEKAATNAIRKLVNYLLDDFRLEGMYVVEHIILRPDVNRRGQVLDSFLPVCVDTNGAYCNPLDPYSFRVAVILPGYSMRLRNQEFRRYAEKLIRMETPAHILPRICFIGIDQMAVFEEVYDRWLNARISSAGMLNQVPDELNKEFIDVLENLYSVYDQGQLSDCDDDTVEKNPVILGRTNLGSLETQSDPPPDK